MFPAFTSQNIKSKVKHFFCFQVWMQDNTLPCSSHLFSKVSEETASCATLHKQHRYQNKCLPSVISVSHPEGKPNAEDVVLLCSGMGVPTVTAARILKGQLNGQSGEETQLEMDKFPFVSLAKVRNHYCCN